MDLPDELPKLVAEPSKLGGAYLENSTKIVVAGRRNCWPACGDECGVMYLNQCSVGIALESTYSLSFGGGRGKSRCKYVARLFK